MHRWPKELTTSSCVQEQMQHMMRQRDSAQQAAKTAAEAQQPASDPHQVFLSWSQSILCIISLLPFPLVTSMAHAKQARVRMSCMLIM